MSRFNADFSAIPRNPPIFTSIAVLQAASLRETCKDFVLEPRKNNPVKGWHLTDCRNEIRSTSGPRAQKVPRETALTADRLFPGVLQQMRKSMRRRWLRQQGDRIPVLEKIIHRQREYRITQQGVHRSCATVDKLLVRQIVQKRIGVAGDGQGIMVNRSTLVVKSPMATTS
jgi:hypothetical protein